MKIIGIFVLWITFSSCLRAQSILTGMVTDSLNHPIPYTSVYFSKTTYGTITSEKGTYSLTIPQEGTYELIASCLGYESQSQMIKLKGQDKQIDFRLVERPFLIKEVAVKDKDKNRLQNYALFLKCFIGESTYSPYCTIENSKDLIVYQNSEAKYLIAYSKKPLIITNSALGYKIIYDLQYFRYNLYSKHLKFAGNYYFQDISNQKRAHSRTNRNRLIAYYGSRMHFLRALFSDSLQQESFEICAIEEDSCYAKELTYSMQAQELKLSISSESMNLYHFYPVTINYQDNHPELFPLPSIYNPRSYFSMITFNDSVKVYKNGYYPHVYDISWSGSMADDRLAEMLPYDFVPKAWKKSSNSIAGILLKNSW